MNRLPKYGLIHMSDGSVKYLKHLEKEGDLIVGHTKVGKDGTTIALSTNNIQEIIGTSEERIDRLRALEQMQERLLDVRSIGKEKSQEYRSNKIAPHLAPSPISNNEEINQWYRHLCNMKEGEKLIFCSEKKDRKHPLTLVTNPEYGVEKPIVEAEMKGINGGHYKIEIDADKGSARAWTQGNGDWKWERPITEVYIIMTEKEPQMVQIEFL